MIGQLYLYHKSRIKLRKQHFLFCQIGSLTSVAHPRSLPKKIRLNLLSQGRESALAALSPALPSHENVNTLQPLLPPRPSFSSPRASSTRLCTAKNSKFTEPESDGSDPGCRLAISKNLLRCKAHSEKTVNTRCYSLSGLKTTKRKPSSSTGTLLL